MYMGEVMMEYEVYLVHGWTDIVASNLVTKFLVIYRGKLRWKWWNESYNYER